MTLRGDETNDLTHPDRLQRELALAWARALHSHVCAGCGMVRICTVIGCEFRPDDRRLEPFGRSILEGRWKCFVCRPGLARLEGHSTGIESAGDEVGGGDDEA